MRAYRIEDRAGFTVGRIIEDSRGHIHWPVVYQAARRYDPQDVGTLDILLDGLADKRFSKVLISA